MDLLKESPTEIREELLMRISEINTYEQLENHRNQYLLVVYGVLEIVTKNSGRAEHKDLASRLPYSTLSRVLQVLTSARIFQTKDKGYKNTEDLRRMKDTKYFFTPTGRQFSDNFIAIAKKIIR